MRSNLMLFWIVFIAAGLALGVGFARSVSPEIATPIVGSIMLLGAIPIARLAWRQHGLRSREGARASVHIAGLSCFAVSTFLADSVLKYLLLGIGLVTMFGVLFDQWKARRRRRATV
jgi:hypothetical protein